MIRDGRIKLKIGGDRSVLRYVNNLPPSGSVTKAWLTVKNNITDADGSAVFQLSITSTITTAGQILDSGATSGVAQIVFNVLAAQTNLLVEGQKYDYDIQVHYNTGTNDQIEEGTVYASTRITQAIS